MKTTPDAPLVTEKHMDLICKAIRLKDTGKRQYLKETISFGVHHYLDGGDNHPFSGIKMARARDEIKNILQCLREANKGLQDIHPIVNMFVFKYPNGMTSIEVQNWFQPRILDAGDRSWANLTKEEEFSRDIYTILVECSKLLQEFFEMASSAPLRGRDGGRINGRRNSCISYLSYVYSEYTGANPRDKLNNDRDTKTYDSPFFRFVEVVFEIIEPDHGMNNQALGHLIRSVLGPKRRRVARPRVSDM